MDIIATIVTSLAMLFTLFSIIKAVLDYRMKKHLINSGLIGYEHIHALLTKNSKTERLSIIKKIIILTMLGSGLVIASFMGDQNAVLTFGFVLLWVAGGLTVFLYFIKEKHHSQHKSLFKQMEEKNRA